MFFKHILKLPEVRQLFLRDRVDLLKKIVRASYIQIPFQNVTSFGVPDPGPKPTPNVKALLDAFHTGCGGLCSHNNYSIKLVLESIGYETYLIAAKFRRTLMEGSHVVCMAKIPPPFSVDKTTEDLYIVDIACGVPFFEPVRIGSLPYKGRAGGFDFSYQLHEDGTSVSRINHGGDAIAGKRPAGDPSPQDYTIQLAPTTHIKLREAYGTVYDDPRLSAFHNTFYLYRYLHIEPDDSDFKIVCIRGKELVVITRETREVESVVSFADVKPWIAEYFPMIPSYQVDIAVKNFSRVESNGTK